MAVYGSSFPGPEGFIEAICSTMLASNKYNLQHNACFQYVQSAARCLHTSNDYVNVMLHLDPALNHVANAEKRSRAHTIFSDF